MEAKSLNDYIGVGSAIRFLIDVRAGWPVHGGFVLDQIAVFLESLAAFDLDVTARAAQTLRAFEATMKKTDEKHGLSGAEAIELKEIMVDLKRTFKAEAQGKFVYVVTDKRLDVSKLLYDVPGLLAANTFAGLPSIAQVDFSEAAKCIAFELPTAAAFHLLRGTEAVLRDFYCSIVKQNRLPPPLMWGPMIDQLRARPAPPPKPVLDHLDIIRENFRNPTLHPEMVYDIDEAQDLFSLCIAVANRMLKVLPAASAVGPD
jgi:hypothetical protein